MFPFCGRPSGSPLPTTVILELHNLVGPTEGTGKALADVSILQATQRVAPTDFDGIAERYGRRINRRCEDVKGCGLPPYQLSGGYGS